MITRDQIKCPICGGKVDVTDMDRMKNQFDDDKPLEDTFVHYLECPVCPDLIGATIELPYPI